MVKVSDIEDRDSLEAWLLDRPGDETKTFAIAIAHRAAMRVVPIHWHWVETSEFARKRDLTALPFLRCNLISGVARKIPTPEIKAAAAFATAAAATAADAAAAAFVADAAFASSAAAVSSAAAAATAADAADAAFARAATAFAADAATATALAADAAFAFATAADAFWREIRSDCDLLENGDMLLTTLLWNSSGNPFQKKWDAVRTSLSPDWSFWINWYQDALEGQEPDWDMLAEIALIPDGDWEKGPEHINNHVIAGIVEKYRLLRDVQALRKELTAVRQTATAAPMGHNNPPEGIEAEAEVVTQTEIIWAALEEAEEELSKPEPSPSDLKRVGTAILGALKKALKYCAGLADVILKNAAEEGGAALGKWGVRGLMAWLVVQEPHVATIAEKLIDFAKWLIA